MPGVSGAGAGEIAVAIRGQAIGRRADINRDHVADGRLILRAVVGERRVERVVKTLLFQVRKQINRPRQLPAAAVGAAGRERLDRVVIHGQRDADLPQIVANRRAAGRFARLLNRRQQQRHQCADDRDDDQQLDEAEAASQCDEYRSCFDEITDP